MGGESDCKNVLTHLSLFLFSSHVLLGSVSKWPLLRVCFLATDLNTSPLVFVLFLLLPVGLSARESSPRLCLLITISLNFLLFRRS